MTPATIRSKSGIVPLLIAKRLAASPLGRLSSPFSPRARRLLVAVCVVAIAAAAAGVVGFASPEGIVSTPGRVPALAVLTVAACFAVWGPGLLIASALDGRHGALGPAITVIAAAGVGWLLFWAWFWSPQVGMVAASVVLVGTCAGLALRPSAMLGSGIARPFGTAILVSLMYVFLAGARGGLAEGPTQIAHRYWVSADNSIPLIFADVLTTGRGDLRPFLVGDWQSSDRPPLETGMILSVIGFVPDDLRPIVYIALGVAANAVWVLALWSVLRTLRVPESRIVPVVLAVAVTGAVFVNTVYAWPKLLAGSLVLAAAAILLARGLPPLGAGLGVGVALALAMLAHGGAAAGVIGICVVAGPALREWGRRGGLAFIGAAVATYLPWVLYQRLFDPPGDRLPKWHLAGAVDVTEMAVVQAIIDGYAAEGLVGTVMNKVGNLRVMAGVPENGAVTAATPGWSGGVLDVIREAQLHYLLPAAGILLVGVAALVVPRVRRHPWVRPIAAIVLATGAAYSLIEFGEPDAALAFLHTSPYSLLLLLGALGALGALELGPRWAGAVLGAHAVFFVVVWVATVSTKSALGEVPGEPWSVDMSVAAALAAVGLGLVSWAAATSTTSASTRQQHLETGDHEV